MRRSPATDGRNIVGANSDCRETPRTLPAPPPLFGVLLQQPHGDVKDFGRVLDEFLSCFATIPVRD
jgi:hypothetical protein